MIVSSQNIVNVEARGAGYAFLVKNKDSYDVYSGIHGETRKIKFIQVDLLGRTTIVRLSNFEEAKHALIEFANKIRRTRSFINPSHEVYLEPNVLTLFEKAYNRYAVVELKSCGEVVTKADDIPTFNEAAEKLNVIARNSKCKVIGSLLCKVTVLDSFILPNKRAL